MPKLLFEVTFYGFSCINHASTCKVNDFHTLFLFKDKPAKVDVVDMMIDTSFVKFNHIVNSTIRHPPTIIVGFVVLIDGIVDSLNSFSLFHSVMFLIGYAYTLTIIVPKI
jgi:hypothetical protein